MSALTYTSILSILCSVTGNGRNTQDNPVGGPVTMTTSPGTVRQVALVGGNNSYTPTPGTTYMVIVPPPASANLKTIKLVNGDAGYPFMKGPLVLENQLAQDEASSFVIGSVGSETLQVFEY